MAPPTLVSMAQRAAARDIAGLQDVGDINYELIRPILKKIADPDQLRKLEQVSPHITDHDSELWKAFIARDIPQWQQKIMEPKNPRSWGKVYYKLLRAERKAEKEQVESLMASLKGLDQKKEANQVTHVQRVLHEPTRHRPLFADGIPNPYVNKSGAVKHPVLKNAKSGRDVMYALKRDTANASKAKGLVAQPARAFVRSARSQIGQAPAAMIRDHQKPQLTAAAQQMASERTASPTPRAFMSRPAFGPSAMDRAIDKAVRVEREQKEQRLRALASGKPALPLSPPDSQRSSTTRDPQVKRPAGTLMPNSSLLRTSASPAAEPKRAGIIRDTASPSPAPALVRKRPAASIFMPTKRRKV